MADDNNDKTLKDLVEAQTYIEKLKDESAKRRIENTKLKDQMKENTDAGEKTNTILAELKAKVEKYDTAAVELENKNKSDNEKQAIKITDLEKLMVTTVENAKKLETALKAKDRKIASLDRNQLTERLVTKLNYKFASDYERVGFMSAMGEKTDEAFTYNNEEVVLKVKDFVKVQTELTAKNTADKKAAKATTPGSSGQQTKHLDVPVAEEITSLLGKFDLTEQDNKRLDELLLLVDG